MKEILPELRELVPKTAHEIQHKQGEPETLWLIRHAKKCKNRNICRVYGKNAQEALERAIARYGNSRDPYTAFRSPSQLELKPVIPATKTKAGLSERIRRNDRMAQAKGRKSGSFWATAKHPTRRRGRAA